MNTTSVTAGLPSVTFWSVIIILTTTSPGGFDTRTENIFRGRTSLSTIAIVGVYAILCSQECPAVKRF